MGLDAVEIVLRTEDVFGISISDAQAATAVTVGLLYEVICYEVGLPPTRPAGTGIARPLKPFRAEHRFFDVSTLRITPPPTPPPSDVPAPTQSTGGWTNEDIWATLVALVIDQLQCHPDEVQYDARWLDDLGVD